MKIALTSDLHMGHSSKTAKYLRKFFNELKVKYSDVDIVVIAGDLSSTKIIQFKKCLRLLREYWYGPVLVVAGNHDFWNGEAFGSRNWRKYYSYQEIIDFHMKTCEDLNMTYLGDGNGPWINEEESIRIYGFDGWYGARNPNTNDTYWMPKQTPEGANPHEYMYAKAHKELYEILDHIDHKNKLQDYYVYNILVTHFQPFPTSPMYSNHAANPNWLPEITKRFDYLLCGHTHQELTKIHDSCVILNSGSDYNAPKWKVFDV